MQKNTIKISENIYLYITNTGGHFLEQRNKKGELVAQIFLTKEDWYALLDFLVEKHLVKIEPISYLI